MFFLDTEGDQQEAVCLAVPSLLHKGRGHRWGSGGYEPFVSCGTVRNPAAAVTVAPGPSPPPPDSADQYLSATARSGEP